MPDDDNMPSFGPGKVSFQLKVNGKEETVSVEPCVTLLEALREDLNLTGTKQVCDRATCGACTVLADGKRVYSCSVLAIDAQSVEITTIESLAQNGELDELQKKFVEKDASQCGYCTAGFIMSAVAFLAENPDPRLEDIRQGMSGNLCRCGTYVGIEQALLEAAAILK
jgi:aerobic-type carbon monoxide dehydrogenase small subunit (CoxS/CutS family)